MEWYGMYTLECCFCIGHFRLAMMWGEGFPTANSTWNLEHGVSKHPCFPTLNLTTCWVLCIVCGCMPNGSWNHHYGGRRGIWRPGPCMLAQLACICELITQSSTSLSSCPKMGNILLGTFKCQTSEKTLFSSWVWPGCSWCSLSCVKFLWGSEAWKRPWTDLGFPAGRWQSAHQGLQDAQLAKPAAA